MDTGWPAATKVITTRRYKNTRQAPDMVGRDAVDLRPNQVRVAATIFVRTVGGFLSLTVILDARSRTIAGWPMANHFRAEPVPDVLEMAAGAPARQRYSPRRPGQPAHIIHTPRKLSGSRQATVDPIGRSSS